MENFASASMVRLLARGMAERGMAVSGFKLTPAAARVPLQQKRQLVGAIVEKGGLSLLLALARQVHLIAGEPLHQALVCAADPLDFFARWQRLERYVHAVHRLRPVHREPGVLSLQHIALKPVGATPMPAESLAVMGVWIGALETLGTPGLSFEVDGLLLSEAPGEDALRRCAGAGRLNRWTLRWAQGASTGVAPRAGAEPTSQLDPQSASLSLPWCGPALSLAQHLLGIGLGAPNLAAAARDLGLSTRTLQRRLASQGLSFGLVLADLRVRLASLWLAQSAHGLADIGYVCGYADQSHFTREFTHRAGMPPQRFRQAATASAHALPRRH